MLPISEEHVALFEPLVLPLTLSMLSVLCVAIGLGHPKKSAAEAAKAPEEFKGESLYPKNVEQLMPTGKRGSVAAFMSDCLVRSEGDRLAAENIFQAYQGWCASKGSTALNAAEFGERLNAICERVGIRRGIRLSLVNVKLAS